MARALPLIGGEYDSRADGSWEEFRELERDVAAILAAEESRARARERSRRTSRARASVPPRRTALPRGRATARRRCTSRAPEGRAGRRRR